MPYLQCSITCQKLDWPRHRSECGLSEIAPQFKSSSHDSTKVPADVGGKASLCGECHGSGLTDAKPSPSLPLPRLEGIIPGCVVRQKNCSVCGGSGLIYSKLISRPSSIRSTCHVCQAYGGESCSCGHAAGDRD